MIASHVAIDRDKVKVTLERGEGVSTLEPRHRDARGRRCQGGRPSRRHRDPGVGRHEGRDGQGLSAATRGERPALASPPRGG